MDPERTGLLAVLHGMAGVAKPMSTGDIAQDTSGAVSVAPDSSFADSAQHTIGYKVGNRVHNTEGGQPMKTTHASQHNVNRHELNYTNAISQFNKAEHTPKVDSSHCRLETAGKKTRLR